MRPILAKGAATINAGTTGYRLALPKKAKRLKPGAYKLTVSFKPRTGSDATTRNVTVRLTGKRPKAATGRITTVATSNTRR